jgi:hypothetical protein
LTPYLPTWKLSGVEVDVAPTSEEVCKLSNQVGLSIALGKVPYRTENSSDASGKWRNDKVVRTRVVVRSTKEAPDYRERHAGRENKSRVDVRRDEVVVCIRGLRACDVDVEDAGNEAQRSLSIV